MRASPPDARAAGRGYLILLGLLTQISAGSCLTYMTVHEARNPHPHFSSLVTVTEAALHEDQFFLALRVGRHSGKQKTFETLVIRMRLSDLDLKSPSEPLAVTHPGESRMRMPIRLTGKEAMPKGSRAIPLVPMDIESLAALHDHVLREPPEPRVLVVTLPEGERPISGAKDSEGGRHPPAGPVIVLVHPGEDSVSRIAVTRDFVERPRVRRALLLLTPLTVVGDALTFPVQFILAISSYC